MRNEHRRLRAQRLRILLYQPGRHGRLPSRLHNIWCHKQRCMLVDYRLAFRIPDRLDLPVRRARRREVVRALPPRRRPLRAAMGCDTGHGGILGRRPPTRADATNGRQRLRARRLRVPRRNGRERMRVLLCLGIDRRGRPAGGGDHEPECPELRGNVVVHLDGYRNPVQHDCDVRICLVRRVDVYLETSGCLRVDHGRDLRPAPGFVATHKLVCDDHDVFSSDRSIERDLHDVVIEMRRETDFAPLGYGILARHRRGV